MAKIKAIWYHLAVAFREYIGDFPHVWWLSKRSAVTNCLSWTSKTWLPYSERKNLTRTTMTDILKFPGVDDDPDDAVFCEECGAVIPPERLEAIPDTKFCVKHSTTKAKVGFMEPLGPKGTASAITFVDADDEESLRRARKASSGNELERR